MRSRNYLVIMVLVGYLIVGYLDPYKDGEGVGCCIK